MTAYKSFKQAYNASDLFNQAFETWDARKLRYSILWAMYENTAYDQVHTWAQSYKTQYGLYNAIRNIYNPTYRLGSFWQAKLFGGFLDPDAGDGLAVPSCIPILTDNEALRPAIAQLWQWSNWQVRKDIFSLWSSVLGDGLLKVEDDPIRGKVYLSIVHPSKLRDITLDEFGHVKGYILEYPVDNPNGRGGQVIYREIATRDGSDVVYQTYKDDALYAWDENTGAEWVMPYGFVPMVAVKHNDVGLSYGWSEIYPGLSKFREVDDQASKLNDQVRRMVEGAWLLAGVSDPKKALTITGRGASQSESERAKNPQPGREEMKVIYSNDANAKAHSLVGNLDIGQVIASIDRMTAELERDYPELRVDLANATGDISGRALRVNRSSAEGKVLQRRPNYDDALVRAQQMAVAIGGWRGYFPGFNLDSYAAGDLDHTIGQRPVFNTDPLDVLELEDAFWKAANQAKAAGVPLPAYLKLQGWDDEKIAQITSSPEYVLRLDSMNLAVEGQRAAQRGDMFIPDDQEDNEA